jgi:hypothetical protein
MAATVATSELYGRQKAMSSLLGSVILSLLLLSNFNYFVKHQLINGIVFISFLSLFLSAIVSTSLFASTKSILSLYKRSLISFAAAAVADGVVMTAFLANYLSFNQLIAVFTKELLFKGFYSTILCSAIFAVFYLVQISYNKKIKA